jgi:hypothetical protein
MEGEPYGLDRIGNCSQNDFMVMWCADCGRLMGLRQPLEVWEIDQTGICPDCLEKQLVDESLPLREAARSEVNGPSDAALGGK